jgi:hypothetical protein
LSEERFDSYRNARNTLFSGENRKSCALV